MKKYLLLIFLCALAFTSCLKDPNDLGYFDSIICKGVVLDYMTDSPIPNVEIMIARDYDVVNSTTTAEDGTFEISLPVELLNSNYYLLVKCDSLRQEFVVYPENVQLGEQDYDFGEIFLSGREVPYPQVMGFSDITPTSAVCNGLVVSDGYAPILEAGFVYDTILYPTLANRSVSADLDNYSFSATITLIPDKTYYVRAYARNEEGIGYSVPMMLRSGSILPQVTTAEVSDVSSNSAVCGGDILSDGGSKIISKGLCWSITGQPTLSNSHVEVSYGPGPFEGSITHLLPNTTYYVRAYAQNESGLSYGQVRAFTTLSGLPQVQTVRILSLGSDMAEIESEVLSDGGYSVIHRGVCYSTSPNPTISSNHTSDGAGIGLYSSYLTNLTPGVRYYYRAYATNGIGTVYSQEDSFVVQ